MAAGMCGGMSAWGTSVAKLIQSLVVVEHIVVLEGDCDCVERESKEVAGGEEGEGEEDEEDGEEANVGVDGNGGEQGEDGDDGDADGLDLSKEAVVEDEESAISSHD